MENIEFIFEYDNKRYASILVDSDNVEIVEIVENEKSIELKNIEDDNLYSKLVDEYKKYDLGIDGD